MSLDKASYLDYNIATLNYYDGNDNQQPTTPVSKPICWRTRKEFSITYDEEAAPYQCAIPDVKNEKKNDDGSPVVNAIDVIMGNVDKKNELLPVILEMTFPFEPNWGSEDQVFSPPGILYCIAHISGLTSGQNYSLLRFDSPVDVPDSDFLSSGTFVNRIDFTAPCSNYDIKDSFMSDSTCFYRCVKNTNNTKSKWPLGTDRTDHKVCGKITNTSNCTGISTKTQLQITDIVVNKDGTLKNGTINHKNWEWTFPNTPVYGQWENKTLMGNCYQIQFDDSISVPKALMLPVRVFFGISGCGTIPDPNNNGSTIDVDTLLFGDDGAGGYIGVDNRLYIESPDLYQTYSFSLGPPDKNGVFTMMSQDGVTISYIRPVSNNSLC